MKPGAIFVFDGYCRMCSRAVDFIIRRDPWRWFRFAAAQSEAGQALLARYGLASRAAETHVLIEDGRAYTDSTATLLIARRLTGIWPGFYALILIPRPVRDFFYRCVGSRRYALFGKRATCRVPTAEEAVRFMS